MLEAAKSGVGAGTLLSPSPIEHWLVLANCQAMGLAHCLKVMNRHLHVEYYDPAGFSQAAEGILRKIEKYDRVLVMPATNSAFDSAFMARQNVWRIPSFEFNAYHPDIVYMTLPGGDRPSGPMGYWQSMIAYAAFRCGLNLQQAINLYREEVFASLGYFDCWSLARERLIERYRSCGIDIRQRFIEWSRKGPFMHMSTHPKIFCLRDVAELLLRRAGLEVEATGILPHDNLTNGAVFPVYPEIGRRLGVAGSYFFKRGAHYGIFGLEQFVAASYSAYRDSGELVAIPPFAPQLKRALEIIEAWK